MPHRDWNFRIQDILDAVSTISKYTKGMEFNTFIEDRRTVDAVVRNLMIIGEAAVQISGTFLGFTDLRGRHRGNDILIVNLMPGTR